MNCKVFLTGVLSFSLLGSAFSFPETTLASSSKKNDIPKEVLEKVKKTEAENQFIIPETKAWEVSLDGEVTDVTPISEVTENPYSGISVMAVPSDGYNYSFSYYDVNSPKRNWKYKSAGTVRVANTRSTSVNFTYTQQENTTTSWNVSSTISGTTSVKASFLGELELTMGLTTDANKSWSKGTSYGISTSVPGNSTAYLTAYAVGINDYGKLVYKKYTKSGSLVGYYYESAGGTAISKNDANIELTNVDPL